LPLKARFTALLQTSFFGGILLRFGKTALTKQILIISGAQRGKNKSRKFVNFKFNADFTQGANPQPSNLQSRAD